jgi:hypothetical protein
MRLQQMTYQKPKHPAGPPMTLGNMRALGVHRPIAFCHNNACRHQALVDVSHYPDDVEVPLFRRRGSAAISERVMLTCGRIGKLTGKQW